jgi:hypothetical protein
MYIVTVYLWLTWRDEIKSCRLIKRCSLLAIFIVSELVKIFTIHMEPKDSYHVERSQIIHFYPKSLRSVPHRNTLLLPKIHFNIILQFMARVVSALQIFWIQFCRHLLPLHAFYRSCSIHNLRFYDPDNILRMAQITCLLVMRLCASTCHIISLKPTIVINTLLSSTTKMWSFGLACRDG